MPQDTIRSNTPDAGEPANPEELGPPAFRVLTPEEAPVLLSYLLDHLGEESRSRFAPHPFTADAVSEVCRPGGGTVPLVAYERNRPDRLVAYGLLLLRVPDHEAERYATFGVDLADGRAAMVAPSVADAWQGRGVGHGLMARLLDLARDHGRTRVALLGGVQATNARARRYYERWGFREVGGYASHVWNVDMLRDAGERRARES